MPRLRQASGGAPVIRTYKPKGIDGRPISGSTYVSVVLRENLAQLTARPNTVLSKILIAAPDRCDHSTTICSEWNCMESWSVDYRLLLHRTGGGRGLASVHHIHDQLDLDKLRDKPAIKVTLQAAQQVSAAMLGLI